MNVMLSVQEDHTMTNVMGGLWGGGENRTVSQLQRWMPGSSGGSGEVDHRGFPRLCRAGALSGVGDSLPGDEHVQHGVLLDVLHRLLVCHHGEVVSVHLEYFVVNLEAAFRCWAALVNLCDIDSVIGVSLWASREILINSASNLEAAFHYFPAFGVDANFFRKLYGDTETLHRSAWLVLKGHRLLENGEGVSAAGLRGLATGARELVRCTARVCSGYSVLHLQHYAVVVLEIGRAHV